MDNDYWCYPCVVPPEHDPSVVNDWLDDADQLWNEIMGQYYSGYLDAINDIAIDGVDLVHNEGFVKFVEWAGGGLEAGEASWFKFTGAAADTIGLGFDQFNYLLRTAAIYDYYSDPDRTRDVTLAQLDYLNTRALAEVKAGQGLTAAAMIPEVGPAIAAGTFVWNWYAISEGVPGPDERLARVYTDNAFILRLSNDNGNIAYSRPQYASFTGQAMMVTDLMVSFHQQGLNE